LEGFTVPTPRVDEAEWVADLVVAASNPVKVECIYE
jgi:hypothetical protein